MSHRSLLLLAAALGLVGCPGGGSLDDDDATPPATDDDDDATDDDDAVDDDDTLPTGLLISGELQWQPTFGALPAGPVRIGAFWMDGFASAGAERWSTQVSKDGLIGNTIYALEVDEEGAPSADLAAVDSGDADVDGALYVLFGYVDIDSSGDHSTGDALLGSSDLGIMWLASEDEDAKGELEAVGAGLGWNTVSITGLVLGGFDFEHTPDGTNSNNGPEIEVELLPRLSGQVPLRTDLPVPDSSVVAGVHTSLFDDNLPTVTGPEVQSAAVSNGAVAGGALTSWSIDAPPPAAHIGNLENTWGIDGAAYGMAVYYDDGDSQYTVDTCDTVYGVVEGVLLAWVEPSTLSLDAAFFAQRTGISMGWSLFEQDAQLVRPLSVGVDLVLAEDALGDDDDSAGDDDDSAGDDDDSAGTLGVDDLGIPAECLPSTGDDDDSAGDDDDSAGDDDDSAGDDDDSAGDDDDSAG